MSLTIACTTGANSFRHSEISRLIPMMILHLHVKTLKIYSMELAISISLRAAASGSAKGRGSTYLIIPFSVRANRTDETVRSLSRSWSNERGPGRVRTPRPLPPAGDMGGAKHRRQDHVTRELSGRRATKMGMSLRDDSHA